MNILQKCAEILVESGYARCNVKCPESLRIHAPEWHDEYDRTHLLKTDSQFPYFVDPFADALEGRRQANAIEDWLRSTPHNRGYWTRSFSMGDLKYDDKHQWRLDRIKYCIKELIKDGDK